MQYHTRFCTCHLLTTRWHTRVVNGFSFFLSGYEYKLNCEPIGTVPVFHHLFVAVDVDDGIVYCAALGQVNRQRCHQWVNHHMRVVHHQHGQASIRHPTYQEGQDHDDDHGRHSQLRFSHCTVFRAGQP